MPKKITHLIAGLLIYFGIIHSGYSQILFPGFTNHNWYFGNSVYSISFNKGVPVYAYLDSVMVTPYSPFGNGVATDEVTGELLFYTDGSTVYDASHRAMPGAVSRPAVAANQGIALSPVPGSPDQYYIFAINGSGDVDYSVVDMQLSGNPPAQFGGVNLGDVSTWRQDLPGNTGNNVSEAMLVVPKANLAAGYWLITQEPNSAIYKVIDIGPGGIGAETSVDLLSAGAVPLTALHFGINPSGQLAVAPKEANKNIHLLDFNFSTGAVTFNSLILNSATTDASASEAIYDVEFSSNSFFASQTGSATDQAGLFAYDLLNPGTTARQIFPGTIFRSYGLKYGPDGKIYHLYLESSGGPLFVGRLENPSDLVDSLVYTERLFQLRNFGAQQFPAVLPQKDITPPPPTIMSLGRCVSDTIWFFPDMDPFTDQFQWDFADANFPADQSAVSPGYNYTSPGGYNVRLTTSVAGNTSTGTLTLNISQTQLQIDLGQDTVICPNDTLLLEIDPQIFPQLQNVVWSNGETNVSSIFVTEGGNYWVSGTDAATGCNINDAIQVDEYGLNITIAAIWYFGNQAGLDFNLQPPVPLDDGAMTAPEGCAAYSDRNGDILFYTDGQTVYNNLHQIMPNGTNLAADPGAAQSTLIVQFPSNETMYYIFSNTCTNPLVTCDVFQLSYSVVDLKVAFGGDVVIKNKPLFKNSTERITAVSFGNTVWLIAHEFGTNAFRAYPITELGIGAPVLSSVGSIHNKYDGAMGDGYMKLSTDGTRIAVALPSSSSNIVELFDFNASSGIVSNPLQLDLNDASGKVYGVEFSPNSNWLYATLSNFESGAQSKIYQWHVDSTTLAGNVTDPDYIKNSRAIIPGGTTTEALGAIQISPNSTMYVAINGQPFLGTINNPDGQQDGTTNAFADLTSGQPLAGGTSSALGLPNFVQNLSTQLPLSEIFIPATACAGDLINFSATATSIIDEFAWSIFDSSGGLVGTSTNQGDTITLDIPDTYIFSVRIFNRCLDPIAILTDSMTVFPIPIDPFGFTAVPICDQSITLTPYNNDQHTEYDYLWSTGETTQDITVNMIGTYSLVITDPLAGCTNDFEVFVGPPFTVNLGTDRTICDGTSLTLDSQANADDYIWELIVGGTVFPITGFETSRFLPLDQLGPPNNPALVPGQINTITVGVVDPVSPVCIVRDTVEITINALPVVNVTTRDATICGVSDGEMDIGGSQTDDITYIVTSSSILVTNLIPAGTGPVTLTGLASGVYSVTITSSVTGCTASQNGIAINEPATFNIDSTPTSDDGCDPSFPSGTITFVLDIDVFPLTYTLRDQTTNTPVLNHDNVNLPAADDSTNFTLNNIPTGTYSLDINTAGCTAFATDIFVDRLPVTDLDGPAVVTACDTQVFLSNFFTTTTPGAVIEWSPDGNAGSYQDAVTVPFTTLGITDIFIRASNDPLVSCDSIRNTQVVLTPEPTVEVDIFEDCSGFVRLTAIPDSYPGAQYIYQWFGGGQPTSISTQQSVDIYSNGTDYRVVVSHSANLTCNVTSEFQTVEVPIPFTVQLNSTPACTDAEFTVTAATFRTDLTYKWFIDGAEQGESLNQIVRENLPGLYRVEASDDKGCTQSDELEIIINDPTPSQILPLYSVCFQEVGTLTVDPGATYLSYTWINRKTGLVIDTSPTFTTDQPGQFQADLINGFQCVTSDAFDVIEDCEVKIIAPNAFRPGSSIETNQTFHLFTEFVSEFEIFVYNRWGELIFHSSEKDFIWNGTLNGVLSPAGSYTWVVKYTKEFGGKGETLRQYGGITLVR